MTKTLASFFLLFLISFNTANAISFEEAKTCPTGYLEDYFEGSEQLEIGWRHFAQITSRLRTLGDSWNVIFSTISEHSTNCTDYNKHAQNYFISLASAAYATKLQRESGNLSSTEELTLITDAIDTLPESITGE